MLLGGKGDATFADASSRPGQGEALAVWVLWAACAAVVLVTYARRDPAELYNVSRDGLEGGLGRALVLVNYPISIVACALVLASAAALPRRAWWVAAPAIALCSVTAWPGVVEQEDLDARWVNAIPAAGVVLALCLTIAAARRAGAGFARRLPGDPARVVLAAALVALSLPWISAELGWHLPGDVFLGEELGREDDGSLLAAVHLGHHHGTDGALIVASALLLSRVGVHGRVLRHVYTGYVAALFGYGLVNAVQDAWLEQLVKRGWLEWEIPSAIEPRLEPVWLAVVAVALVAAAAVRRERANPR